MENQSSTQPKVVYNDAAVPDAAAPKKKVNKRFIIILSALVIGGGLFGFTKWNHAQSHEETDDAQIEGSINPVIPRISGYLDAVKVADNQVVKKGDTLLVLDNRDLKIRVDLAEAALSAAKGGLGVAEATTTASRSNISTTEANVATVSAQIEAAKVNVWRATQDFNRYANLIKDHSITQQQYEQAVAAKQSAERQVQVLVEQRNAASRQTSAASTQSAATGQQVSVANATIKQREADLQNAKLNLSYTIITAPSDGLVSKVNVQNGQFVQAGQSLFAIVANSGMWVVANFKETQLKKMVPGQKVIVHVDAYGGHEFNGTLASFSPATGARFSLLPPDNASGNFVKVVQRVPVKIEFTDKNDALIKNLRPGMNVDVDVHLN